MNRELWPHQAEALLALRQSVAQGVRRIVLSAPTGSGKTLLSAAVVEGALEKGNRVAFVVSSISLVDQTVEALYAEGIRGIGVIQANHEMTDWSQPVQVASIQTIKSRKKYPEAAVVIYDECHVLHEEHKKWLQQPGWEKIPFIGLSATPYTRGLGKYFETMIVVSTTQDLINGKILSPFRVFATGHPDLSKVRTVAGDYHEGELSEAMQAGTLTADIVRTWQEKWNHDRTLCFAVDCAHAQSLQKRFEEAGIPCGYQDARTPPDERREIKRKFHNGDYQVVANVGTLTTGVDWDVRCLILARPTRSEMLYQQIVGRSLRTAPGKEYALILDHSDTTQRLGFVTDIYHPHLDDGKPKQDVERKVPLPRECPSCSALRPRGRAPCPSCGHVPEVVSGVIEHDGELVELVPGQPKKAAKRDRVYTMEEKGEFFGQLRYLGKSKGYKDGWAAMKYREKFGVFPRGLDHVGFKPPSATTLSWLRSRQIAWAKSQRRDNVHA
jgi:superfamily II DNA or RNA helicase